MEYLKIIGALYAGPKYNYCQCYKIKNDQKKPTIKMSPYDLSCYTSSFETRHNHIKTNKNRLILQKHQVEVDTSSKTLKTLQLLFPMSANICE